MMKFYVEKIAYLIGKEELPTAILSFEMQRKKEILLMKNEQKRLESAAATILINRLLVDSNYLKDDIKKDVKGRPEFLKQKELFCSISHSKDYVACAIADQPIGIDIQIMKEIEKEKFSKRFFSKEEQKYLNQEISNEKFYKIWTSKESYLKMIGIGLRQKLNLFQTDLENNFICDLDGNKLAKLTYKQQDKYMICICEK